MATQGKDEAWQEHVYRIPANGREEPRGPLTIRVVDVLSSAGAYKAAK